MSPARGNLRAENHRRRLSLAETERSRALAPAQDARRLMQAMKESDDVGIRERGDKARGLITLEAFMVFGTDVRALTNPTSVPKAVRGRRSAICSTD